MKNLQGGPLFNKIVFYIQNIISPPHCYFCRIFINDYLSLCDKCSELIKPISSYKIELTQNYSLTVHAVSDYKDPIKPMILAKKWSEYSACKQIAQIIWKNSSLRNIDFDYLVPIPLHWTRFASRGYNQAQVIAQELSVLSGKPVVLCLKRYRRTLYQFLLSSSDRKENVANVFQLISKDNAVFEGKTIMLVDDLMTTGSTLKTAGKILVKLKPKSVQAIVACRVI